jgi:hypothetical protein
MVGAMMTTAEASLVLFGSDGDAARQKTARLLDAQGIEKIRTGRRHYYRRQDIEQLSGAAGLASAGRTEGPGPRLVSDQVDDS